MTFVGLFGVISLIINSNLKEYRIINLKNGPSKIDIDDFLLVSVNVKLKQKISVTGGERTIVLKFIQKLAYSGSEDYEEFRAAQCA